MKIGDSSIAESWSNVQFLQLKYRFTSIIILSNLIQSFYSAGKMYTIWQVWLGISKIIYFLNVILVCPFGYLYFVSVGKWTWIGYINQPAMALTPFPFSVGWDKIRTHDRVIMNLLCYPLDQTFALDE